MSEELIGKQIGGYEILARIGQGGMATVFRARQISMNRMVALKVLPRQFLNDDAYIQRFQREVEIVAKLEHRNIVPVHDYGHHEGQPYIVMRYMTGGSIDNKLEGGRYLSLDAIVSIISQIAPALDYAHSEQVLHRDLKPSNVLMDDAGGAYLTDFGIARILGDQGSNITTQGVVGTPSYMSPEQAQGKPLDGRSDIYSLGVMLFEMATGKRPFEAETPYSTAVLQVTAPVPSPRAINSTLPPSVEQVIYKVLSKEPDKRYTTATEFAAAVRLAVEKRVFDPHDTEPGGFRRSDLSAANAQLQAAPQPVPQPIYPAQPINQPPSQLVYQPPVPTSGQPGYPQPQSPISGASQQIAGDWQSARRSSGRRRRRKQSGVWTSVLIGGMIGCGLVAIVAVIVALVLSNLFGTSASSTLPTADSSSAVIDPNEDGTDEAVSDASTPDLQATSAAGRGALLGLTRTAAPQASATPSRAPTRSATLPVGVRPSSAIGTLVYFDRRSAGWDIFTINISTREELQITAGSGRNIFPTPSPDGRLIAFQSDRDGDFDIYIMTVDGRNTRKLLNTPVDETMPAWSPDGEWLIFASDVRNDGGADLLRVRADGTELALVYSSGDYNAEPRWSPDGVIVFTTGRAADASTWEIARVNLDGTDFRLLTENSIRDYAPTLSPDGSTIAYVSGAAYEAALLRMSVDGANRETLYTGSGEIAGAAFSPDGAFIAFSDIQTNNDEVYIIAADGGDAERITADGGLSPTWLPTG